MGNAPRIPENLCIYDLNMFMVRTCMLGDSSFTGLRSQFFLSVLLIVVGILYVWENHFPMVRGLQKIKAVCLIKVLFLHCFKFL